MNRSERTTNRNPLLPHSFPKRSCHSANYTKESTTVGQLSEICLEPPGNGKMCGCVVHFRDLRFPQSFPVFTSVTPSVKEEIAISINVKSKNGGTEDTGWNRPPPSLSWPGAGSRTNELKDSRKLSVVGKQQVVRDTFILYYLFGIIRRGERGRGRSAGISGDFQWDFAGWRAQKSHARKIPLLIVWKGRAGH